MDKRVEQALSEKLGRLRLELADYLKSSQSVILSQLQPAVSSFEYWRHNQATPSERKAEFEVQVCCYANYLISRTDDIEAFKELLNG